MTNRIGLPATGQRVILSECNTYAAIASGMAFLLLAVLGWLTVRAIPFMHEAPLWSVSVLFQVALLAVYPWIRVFLSRGGA